MNTVTRFTLLVSALLAGATPMVVPTDSITMTRQIESTDDPLDDLSRLRFGEVTQSPVDEVSPADEELTAPLNPVVELQNGLNDIFIDIEVVPNHVTRSGAFHNAPADSLAFVENFTERNRQLTGLIPIETRSWGRKHIGVVMTSMLFDVPNNQISTAGLQMLRNSISNAICKSMDDTGADFAVQCVSPKLFGESWYRASGIQGGVALTTKGQVTLVLMAVVDGSGRPRRSTLGDSYVVPILDSVKVEFPAEEIPEPAPVVGIEDSEPSIWPGIGLVVLILVGRAVIRSRKSKVVTPSTVQAGHVKPSYSGASTSSPTTASQTTQPQRSEPSQRHTSNPVADSMVQQHLRWETEQQREWDAEYFQEELLLVDYWKDKPAGIKKLGLQDRVRLDHKGDDDAIRSKLHEIIQAKDPEAAAVIRSHKRGELVALARHRVCADRNGCCILYDAADCPKCRVSS